MRISLVAEVKWRKLSAAERRHVLTQLEQKWSRTTLSHKYPQVHFEVFDAAVLKLLP